MNKDIQGKCEWDDSNMGFSITTKEIFVSSKVNMNDYH